METGLWGHAVGQVACGRYLVVRGKGRFGHRHAERVATARGSRRRGPVTTEAEPVVVN